MGFRQVITPLPHLMLRLLGLHRLPPALSKIIVVAVVLIGISRLLVGDLGGAATAALVTGVWSGIAVAQITYRRANG